MNFEDGDGDGGRVKDLLPKVSKASGARFRAISA
jgi:hypothetical protein